MRKAVERATHVEVPLPATVADFLAETDSCRRRNAAHTAAVDADLAAFLVSHEDNSLRHRAADNPHVPKALTLTLTADPKASSVSPYPSAWM
ncbi:hypothetical protein M1P56_35205 (plasmid) [Streptomyces sp. HU2014]|uniref:hypothetical protein n=1 Tax=Streptomyces sp. HU2014 TaxID=2939414 RepID=UPI002010251B|nr:hypothetical protein [Streptomyces sp. HU2014]UQI49762.1 hypothetical protein M1P56_35205 [Streptomyces sp. HU2014]